MSNENYLTWLLLRSTESQAPDLQQQMLVQALSDITPTMLERLAGRPGLTPDVVERLTRARQAGVKAALAGNPDVPVTVAAEIAAAHPRPTILQAYAGRADLCQTEYERLAAAGDLSSWQILANPAAGFPAVRAAVARIVTTTGEGQLSQDKTAQLSQAVQRFPILADEIVLTTTSVDLMYQYAGHAGLTCAGVDRLARWATQTATTLAASPGPMGLETFDHMHERTMILTLTAGSKWFTTAHAAALTAAVTDADGQRRHSGRSGFQVNDRLLAALNARAGRSRLTTVTGADYEAAATGAAAGLHAWAHHAVTCTDAMLATVVLSHPGVDDDVAALAAAALGDGHLPQQVLDAHEDDPVRLAAVLHGAGRFTDQHLERCRNPTQVLAALTHAGLRRRTAPIATIVLRSRFMTEQLLLSMPAGEVVNRFNGACPRTETMAADLITRQVRTTWHWQAFTTMAAEDGMTLRDALDAAVLITN
jgi:hypothetical protein